VQARKLRPDAQGRKAEALAQERSRPPAGEAMRLLRDDRALSLPP
jgi:hypothetical protein